MNTPLYTHIPNTLSVARALLTFGVLILLFIPHTLAFAQLLILLAIISDKLDGTLARYWKVESETGKKLESVIDPIFVLVTVAYVLRYLNFPVNIFLLALPFFLVTGLFRIMSSLKYKRLFYEKSPITRYGTAFLYLTIMVYLFDIAFKEVMAWFMLGYSIMMSLNYCRMIIRSIRRQRVNELK